MSQLNQHRVQLHWKQNPTFLFALEEIQAVYRVLFSSSDQALTDSCIAPGITYTS